MTMQDSYETYYGSNHYNDRYPKPNILTLSRVAKWARNSPAVLDIGAGSGRYTVALAKLGHTVVAVERSDEAREQLWRASVASGVDGQVSIYKDLWDVDEATILQCRIALLLFGVLGHMRFEERRATLEHLRTHMPSGSRAIGSVPNRRRRFRIEQATQPIPDSGSPAPRFSYTREFAGTTNTFEYTAYTPGELRSECSLHRWSTERIWSESVLEESLVTRHPIVARFDLALAKVLPPFLGYGLMFRIIPDSKP